MLCSQPFCCQKEIFKKRVGCCTAHAYNCSGTIGVFLRVAECQVLLLHLNVGGADDLQIRGSFVPAPYIDEYGETDQGLRFCNFCFFRVSKWDLFLIFVLRRGNPLRLCQTRYNKLYKDWISHAIPEEISRSYQNQTNVVNVNWVDF